MGSVPNWCNQNESRKLCRSCKEDSLVPLDLKLWGCEPGINKTQEGKAELWDEAKIEQNWQTDSIWILSRSLESLNQFSCSIVPGLFVTPWTAAHQASLSITNSQSPPKPMSIESVMPSNHLILCRPLLLLPSVFPSIRVFSNESALRIRWPKYWNFSFNISPSNEHPGLISFRKDWLALLAVQETLKSLFQHHSSNLSIKPCLKQFLPDDFSLM